MKSISDNSSWFVKYIIPTFTPTIVSLFIGISISYATIQINSEKHIFAEKELTNISSRIDQETKRNNIQDVAVSKLQEKTSNLELTLSRIENSLGLLTIDLKDFMKDIPKEMKNIRKEVADINQSVAVLKDRNNRTKGQI